MGRILPFYRTGGVVSGGGGGGGNTGVPLGPFNDWSELPASAAGGSLALLLTLGPANSSGLAVYDTGDAEWKLQFGTFETLAGLQAFTDPINSLALATVGTLLDDPESVRYQWDDTVPEWVRTPDPVEYIYAANTWGTLPTQDTIKPSDEVIVDDLGYTHSSGRAQRHGSQWRLIEGKFQSVADMVAFDVANPVHTDAIGLVKAGGGHDEEAIAYSYQGGNWVRFGATTTAGYAWTLSSLRDFSAIGLQDGDFGVFTPSGGQPILLRYKAACTTAYGSPMQAWMTPIAYAGTPVMQAWTAGTESNVTLATQGWTLTNDVGCTVTATGGFQRLAAPSTATAARMQCMAATVLAGTRVETIFEARAATSNTSTLALPFMLADGTNGTYFGQAGTLGVGFKNVDFGGPLQAPTRNNATPQMPALNATASFFVVQDEGRTVFDSATLGGLPFANYRRNAQSELYSRNIIQVTAQGQAISGGATATLDYRGQIITY